MKKTVNYFINLTIFLFVITLAVGIATFALTKKVNEFSNQYNKGVIGSVIKKEIPIVATARGSVIDVGVSTGDKVKKEQALVELDNPALLAKIEELEKNPGNASAMTEAGVAKEEAKGLNVLAPAEGIIKEITVVEGSPVDQMTEIGTLYANDEVKILTHVSLDEYRRLRNQRAIVAYCPRLNQAFDVRLEKLQPEQTTSGQNSEKKLGVYFIFENEKAAQSVLQNEDLEIRIEDRRERTKKPVDVFIDFWNSLLSKQ